MKPDRGGITAVPSETAAATLNSTISPTDLRAAMDALVRDQLGTAALALSGLYLIVSVYRLLVQATGLFETMTVGTLGTAALFGGLYGVLKRWQPPLRWVHPLAAALLVVPLVNIIVHLHADDDPTYTTNLVLVLGGSAFFLLVPRWHLLIIALTWIGWASAVWQAAQPTGWQGPGLQLLVATLLSVILNMARYRTLLRLERLRLNDQRRTRELEAAILAVQQSEERFKQLADATFEGVLIHEQGQILDANRALHTMFGYDPGQMLNRSVLDFVAPESQTLIIDRLRSLEETPVEMDGLRKGATCFPIEIHAKTVIFGDRAARVVAVRDLTKQKRAEAALQDSLSRTQALYQASQVLLAAGSLPDLLQNIVDSVVGALNADRVVLITFDLADRSVTQFVKGGTETENVEEVSFDELWDGLSGWVLRERRPAFSPSGTPDPRESPVAQRRRQRTNCGDIVVVPVQCQAEIVGTLTAINAPDGGRFGERDVELMMALANQAAIAIENARLVESLRVSQEKFSKAFLDSPVPMLIASVDDGRFFDVNASFLDAMGYERDAIIGRTSLELNMWVDPAARREFVERLHEHGSVRDLEAVIRTRSGGLIVMLLSAEMIELGGELRLLTIAPEITERKRIELERERLIRELDAFARTVAHDLKNPLNVVLAYADVLQSDSSLPATLQREYLHTISESALKMDDIIDELLLLARVHQDEIKLEPLDMTAIVSGACRRLAHMVEHYQAEINAPPAWPGARGHGPWVEGVWTNYLSNAIKYGGQPPRVELGAAVQEDGMVRFWVRDNGPGLTPEQQTQLFTPFTQVGRDRSEGHGLGLSIVQRIVERLGGQVGVKSAPECGSTFYFTLPGVVK